MSCPQQLNVSCIVKQPELVAVVQQGLHQTLPEGQQGLAPCREGPQHPACHHCGFPNCLPSGVLGKAVFSMIHSSQALDVRLWCHFLLTCCVWLCSVLCDHYYILHNLSLPKAICCQSASVFKSSPPVSKSEVFSFPLPAPNQFCLKDTVYTFISSVILLVIQQ